MKTTYLAAPVAAIALAVPGCGSADDAAPASGNGVDRAFAQEMVPHHRSAVQMARIGLRRGRSAYVKGLSADIVRSQSAEIGEMEAADQRLAHAGVKTGDLGIGHAAMGMDMDTGALEGASPFDPAFLRMMTPHHEGAIVMARAELARGSDHELKQLATRIISAQQEEIGQMRRFLMRG